MKTSSGKPSFFDQDRETKLWSERLQDLNARFLQTLRHAYDHSGAYREISHAAGIDVSAIKGLEDIKPPLDAKVISYTPDVAVITVFGHHLREKPHIHGRMFSSMASVGVGSLAISTSLSSVSCVIKGEDIDPVIRALSETFQIPYEVKNRPKDY
jgi:hypothetical protein